jgi:hypothetical protein
MRLIWGSSGLVFLAIPSHFAFASSVIVAFWVRRDYTTILQHVTLNEEQVAMYVQHNIVRVCTLYSTTSTTELSDPGIHIFVLAPLLQFAQIQVCQK